MLDLGGHSASADGQLSAPVFAYADDEVRIVITRDKRDHAVLAPAEFESFPFHDGDELRVEPAQSGQHLPVTWGDTNIQIRPGIAIRMPPIYKAWDYKGFRIPEHLISLTGAGPETFEKLGIAHIDHFKRHVGIGPDMVLLDMGCGIGRDAFQLFDFLSPRGHYIGIDVTRDSIAWCQRNITARYPNFQFHHFDAENELYNPHGTKTSMDFRLPLADGLVDRIFLSSVFTHMLEAEILHYLKEFRRVLKPTGLVYASFFRLTPEALEAARTKGKTAWEAKFDIPLGNGFFANDPTYPRGAVGFTDEAAHRLIGAAGLKLDRPFLKGWWSGLYGADAEDGQDVMILRR